MRLFLRAGCLRLIVGFLVVTALALGGAQAAGHKKSGDGPAIWKIESRDGKGQVYLFGSVHLLKKGVVWFTPKIEDAFLQATDIVLETNIDPAGVAEIKDFVKREGFYPPDDRLKNHIDAVLFGDVAKLGKQVGLAPETLDRLKPWYAATILSLTFIQSHGFEAQSGVETTLEDFAAKRGLPFTGLETIGEQMQALAGSTPEVQEALLRDSVTELADIRHMLNLLTDAWVSGNTEKLDKTLVQPMRKIPAAYETMLVSRNRKWVPKIQELMNRPGTHFVVVGVAHLVGRDGLIKMLQEKGVKVERV